MGEGGSLNFIMYNIMYKIKLIYDIIHSGQILSLEEPLTQTAHNVLAPAEFPLKIPGKFL